MGVRVDNNDGGQNVGGQRSCERGDNQGSVLDQLMNTFVSLSVKEQVNESLLKSKK